MANIITQLNPGDRSLTLLPLAARTAAPDTQQLVVGGRYSGLIVSIDVTAIVTAPSITCTIYGVDPTTGKLGTLLASSAITAITTPEQRRLQVHPALTPVANLAASALLPQIVRIAVSHANGNSITYSVSAELTF